MNLGCLVIVRRHGRAQSCPQAVQTGSTKRTSVALRSNRRLAHSRQVATLRVGAGMPGKKVVQVTVPVRAWAMQASVGVLLLWLATQQAWAGSCPPVPKHSNEVGVQFPAPPATQDLRESLNAQKACMSSAKPRRLSPSELQELRRAVRAQARYNRVGSAEPEGLPPPPSQPLSFLMNKPPPPPPPAGRPPQSRGR